MTTVRYRHSTVAEKAYILKNLSKSCIPQNMKIYHLNTPPPPTKKKQKKTAEKDTLKPEMQREWTHHLYNYKVKNTFCGKAAVMPVSTTFCFVSATLGFVSSIK